ncbi:AT-rich interactive domain-containing protein 5B [Trichomycterus rosablanca]|uniref:AT-rich interactive domain-containing protein 5B n=1 Tax=Trichomycterus rosablanca TaxID=2290929 RepID=UPI002F35FD85
MGGSVKERDREKEGGEGMLDCNGAECHTETESCEWLGPPCCLRGSFAFYKSVCYKPNTDGPVKVWRLGEFYYVRCSPQEPICIAEVTLLWEDQRQRYPLASCRLYYLPEDTPKGRTEEHGEDEVVGVSKKVVVRVENLVKWTCPEPPKWKGGSLKSRDPPITDSSLCVSATEDLKTKGKYDTSEVQQRVKVLSYPQYCRFRTLQKRLQHRAGWSSLQDPHLMALGWMRMALHNTRVLYCRDTFSHPSLDSNPSLTSEIGCLSVSLKGRPRKRRGRDSDGSEPPSLNHCDSWGERIKDNGISSEALMFEGSWLSHPERQLFLDQLYLFMERRGSPIGKVPNLGFKKIDLFVLYSVVKKLGGYDVVTSQKLWKVVYDELGGSPGSTSAATCTRRHYERLVLPYEQHLKGSSQGLSKTKAADTAALAESIKKPGRGRKVQTVTKKNKVASQAAPPDGVVVRKRGRPPGKRNAKFLPKGKVGRPPSHTKPDEQEVSQPLPVIKILIPSQATTAPAYPALQPKLEDVKKEHEFSTPSLASGQSKLQIGTSLEGFSPTKGMCPLDFFRARLGLSGVGGPESADNSSIMSQTKVGSPETPEVLQHQCSGCNVDHSSWAGSPKEGLTARPSLPPLKILPLNIDCSLQLHQLMHTRLGSAHMNTFTKRLSEALAQDLGKNHQITRNNLPLSQEQAMPLNLSKKTTTKRSSDDSQCGESEAKSLKMEPVDLRLSLNQNGGSSPVTKIQDEPADLSCPRRVRALQDRTSSGLTCSETRPQSPNVSSNSVFPFSVFSPGGALRNDFIPVDLKLREMCVWKTEPERTSVNQHAESCAKGEHLTQCMPYEDYKVSFSKPSQSC